MLYNYKIDQLFSESDVVTSLKIQRLRWAGHVFRMEEDNPVKKLTFQKRFGSRRKSWPKMRWVDGIEADLKTLGMRGWRRKALDRTNGWMCWRRPRPEEGCSAREEIWRQ
jgi:hypothetical protein